MKKALLLFSTTMLLAGSVEERLRTVEERLDALGVENLSGTYGARSALGRIESPNNASVHFDLLYWRMGGGSDDFATSYESNDPTNATSENTTEVVNPLGSCLAFRTGFTYNLPHEGWIVTVDYTRFEGQKTDSTTGLLKGADADVNPAWAATDYAGNATNSYRLGFNAIDLHFSYPFFVGKRVSLTPGFGVIAYTLNTRDKTVFNGSVYSDIAEESIHELINTKTKGLGLIGRGMLGWALTPRWKLFSGLSFGYPLTLEKEHEQDDSPSAPAYAKSEKKQIRSFTFYFTSITGIEYFREFVQSGRSMSLRLAYESLLPGLTNTVLLQGWTLATRVHF